MKLREVVSNLIADPNSTANLHNNLRDAIGDIIELYNRAAASNPADVVPKLQKLFAEELKTISFNDMTDKSFTKLINEIDNDDLVLMPGRRDTNNVIKNTLKMVLFDNYFYPPKFKLSTPELPTPELSTVYRDFINPAINAVIKDASPSNLEHLLFVSKRISLPEETQITYHESRAELEGLVRELVKQQNMPELRQDMSEFIKLGKDMLDDTLKVVAGAQAALKKTNKNGVSDYLKYQAATKFINVMVEASDALNATIAALKTPNTHNLQNLQNLQKSQALMKYYRAQAELQLAIDNMHKNMPENTPYRQQRQAKLQKKLDDIEKRRITSTQAEPFSELPYLTQKLREQKEIAELEGQYQLSRDKLNRYINYLKQEDPNSPFIPFGDEILNLTELRAPSESGVQLHQLTKTLQVTLAAITSTTETLEQNMKNCVDLGNEIVKSSNPKWKKWEKIGGILCGIVGVLLIIASVVAFVVTGGASVMLSAIGVGAGIALTTIGAGLAFSSTHKSHQMKIKETLDNLAKETDTVNTPPNRGGGPANQH